MRRADRSLGFPAVGGRGRTSLRPHVTGAGGARDGKTGWVALIFLLPFFGILIYLLARPKMTEQDKRMMEEAAAQQKRLVGYSSADEIAKLKKLYDEGALSAEEYEALKAKAM